MKTQIADVLIKRGNKLLLVQQRKPAAYGLWSYPGGHVEHGESTDEAVHREVREELGTELVKAHLLTTSLRDTGRGAFELHTYTGDIEGNVITLPELELMAYGWFTLTELERMKDQLRAPFVLDLAHLVMDPVVQ